MISRSPNSKAAAAVKNSKINTNSVIQNQLQMLRVEQEKNNADIHALEQERLAIRDVLPKVYYELEKVKNRIDNSTKELLMFENAIEEIEKNYGDFLFSAEMFNQDTS